MLNFIWGIFIMLGIFISAFTGKITETSNAILEGGKAAVNLSITMLGIISIWTGIMRIAQEGGMVEGLSKKCEHLLSFLFPEVPKTHPARQYIATNFAANLLGLGWAATPAGLLAMDELQKLNRSKEKPSRAMCMFLVINTSSLQLITVSILAYRSQYSSANPSEIVFGAIVATLVSTAVGIGAAKCFERLRL